MSMKFALLSLLLVLTLIPSTIDATSNTECFLTLQSAEIGLTDKQMNDACEDIMKTGEAYIPDFRDRGLIIKFIELGDTISIPLP